MKMEIRFYQLVLVLCAIFLSSSGTAAIASSSENDEDEEEEEQGTTPQSTNPNDLVTTEEGEVSPEAKSMFDYTAAALANTFAIQEYVTDFKQRCTNLMSVTVLERIPECTEAVNDLSVLIDQWVRAHPIIEEFMGAKPPLPPALANETS